MSSQRRSGSSNTSAGRAAAAVLVLVIAVAGGLATRARVSDRPPATPMAPPTAVPTVPAGQAGAGTSASNEPAGSSSKGPSGSSLKGPSGACRTQGALPDRACTPGDVLTTDPSKVCQYGYARSVRNVPFAEKQAVYAEYGITSHQPGQYEVDHLISLELGGSNSVQNLWPEAAEPRPGFHEKDQVENYLHQLVCSGRLDLETAQAEIRDDWLQVYVAMTVPNATPLPSPQPTVDNGAGVAAMNIRPERVTDYAAIADVNARAFGNRASEPAIVALHRQRVAFDPELSLVAEAEGRVVGHALFSPRTVRLLGRDVPAVSLAPIAVLPEAQRQGIGGRLIEEGHRVARTKGFPFSFLIGHADYYPRFGYEQHAYGFSRVTVPVRELPAGSLEERAPAPHDLSGLQELWRRAEGPVDFTLAPDIDLLAWVSPNPAVESIVFRRDGEIVGYSRVSALEPEKPRVFLARDAETARLVAGALARRAGAGSTELVLPLHPASPAAAAFPAPSLQTSKAAMAAPLSPSPLDEYLAQVRVGKRLPGHVIWPVEFDL